MIKLCYKNFVLGQLNYDSLTKEYVYNSNLENEKRAKEKYSELDFYYLTNSVNRRSKKLFKDFIIFMQSASRKDIVSLAGIEKEDSEFEILQKIASINMIDDSFYITL